MQPHEIPTHLEVADKLVFGLTARQAIIIGIGLCLGYVCVQQTQLTLPALGNWNLPLILRIGCGLLPALGGVVIAWVRPLDRPLEIWVLVWLRYQTLPKIWLWRQPRPRTDLAHEQEILNLLRTESSSNVEGHASFPSTRWTGRHIPDYMEVSDGR